MTEPPTERDFNVTLEILNQRLPHLEPYQIDSVTRVMVLLQHMGPMAALFEQMSNAGASPMEILQNMAPGLDKLG